MHPITLWNGGPEYASADTGSGAQGQVPSTTPISQPGPNTLSSLLLASGHIEPTNALLNQILMRCLGMQMMIVVMDELDHACKAAEGLVRDLFSMAMARGSRLVMLGIANKLDLTERLLLDLKSCQAAPVVLSFLSYSAKQILQVLKVCCCSAVCLYCERVGVGMCNCLGTVLSHTGHAPRLPCINQERQLGRPIRLRACPLSTGCSELVA